MMRSPRRSVLTAGAIAALAVSTFVSAVEPTAQGVKGSLPEGDKEIFQPGTQPCTVPGYGPSCFHTDHTDEFDRKFHPSQGTSSQVAPLHGVSDTVNAVRPGDLPYATDGSAGVREELVCSNCHGNYTDAHTGEPATYAPYETWQGTMMAQSWRDPLARAAIAVANHALTSASIDYGTGEYSNSPFARKGQTAGDYCIRCHSPVGWLEGNSLPADGSRVRGKQMDGVQCDFCHRSINPLTHIAEVPDNYAFQQNLPRSLIDPDVLPFLVPRLQNGNFIVNRTGAKIGPYPDPVDIGQHLLDAIENVGTPPEDAKRQLKGKFPSAAAENIHFMQNSQFCAVCHNVTNPILKIPEGPGAGQFMPVERTYTEWYYSDCGPAEKGNPNRPLFPEQTPDQGYAVGSTGCDLGHRSCQDCHMPAVEGYAADPARMSGAPDGGRREKVRQHIFVGGNTWAQDMIPLFFPDQAPLQPVFDRVQAMARDNLRMAAGVSATLGEDGTLRVDVENLTGHKLPTGYPEGRRMWLHVQALDGTGQVIYSSGDYDFETAELSEDHDLKIWKASLGIKRPWDAEPEHSFHFILNNYIFKDNRVPPPGFDIAAGKRETTLIVRSERDCLGYAEAFGEHAESACESMDFDGDGRSEGSDVVFYRLPAGVEGVRITLYYQTASREYVEFLSDRANSGDYYDRFNSGLKYAWDVTGKSAPVDMACVEVFTGEPSVGCPLSEYRTDNPLTSATTLLTEAVESLPSPPEPEVDAPTVGVGTASINSVRPGEIVRGSGDTMITIYIANGDASQFQAYWGDQLLASAAPRASRLVATVPAALLAETGSGRITLHATGSEASNAVDVQVVDAPTDCSRLDAAVSQACPEKVALGEVPVIQMLPQHTWNPYATVPAGGMIKVENYDSGGLYGAHTVTHAALEDRVPLVPGEGGGGRFHVSVDHPPRGGELTDNKIGYLRVLEEEEPGQMPFYCTQHVNSMYPPTGIITVR